MIPVEHPTNLVEAGCLQTLNEEDHQVQEKRIYQMMMKVIIIKLQHCLGTTFKTFLFFSKFCRAFSTLSNIFREG
jgi:hypothetical protein